MDYQDQLLLRQKKMADAIRALSGSADFQQFIEMVRTMKEDAFQSAISEAVAKDERLTLLTLGEAKSYNAIIDIYDEIVRTPVPQG